MEHIKKKGNVVKIIADSSYSPHVVGKPVCKITDTGNGYIAKFPAFSSVHQNQYICLDYSQAAYLLQGLAEFNS